MSELSFKTSENDEYIVRKVCFNPNTKKKYLIYKKENEDDLLASIINIDNNNFFLDDIETEEEYAFLEGELSNE